MNKPLKLAVVPVFAFLGGFAAQVFLAPQAVEAASKVGQSQPVFFYGEDGKVRLQMGLYDAAGEKGLPLVGLSDNQGRLRMLFRLAGGNESPVIIMKDTGGQDRLVMGLDLSGPAQAPFLSIVDENGVRKSVFGND